MVHPCRSPSTYNLYTHNDSNWLSTLLLDGELLLDNVVCCERSRPLHFLMSFEASAPKPGQVKMRRRPV